MKRCLLLLFIVSLAGNLQAQRNFAVRAMGNFDFGVRGPSLDDGGFGLQLTASAFARHKLNFAITAHSDILLGDKELTLRDVGRINKTSIIRGIQAGPEYFITKGIAVSIAYGIFWHSIKEEQFNADDGYRLSTTLFPGKTRRFAMHLGRVYVPNARETIKYWYTGLGYRFY